MIDIHNHYLAAVDDGPDTLDESIYLAKIASEQGITHVLCTPHYHPSRYGWEFDKIQTVFDQLKTALDHNSINLHLALATEVHLSDEILPLIKQGKIPFAGIWEGKQAMLLEMPHGHVPLGVDKLIKWLIKEGIQPIIVHPERNKGVMRNLREAEVLVNAGALFQVTAGSVAGHFGDAAQQSAYAMLDNNWVQFIASDAHNPKRPPAMKVGYNALIQYALAKSNSNDFALSLAQKLTLENPQKLTENLFAQ